VLLLIAKATIDARSSGGTRGVADRRGRREVFTRWLFSSAQQAARRHWDIRRKPAARLRKTQARAMGGARGASDDNSG
jgi:hypothetical protein